MPRARARAGDIAHVERFAEYVARAFGRVDVVVNNACQTVRRPPAYYAHLMRGELREAPALLRPLLAHNEAFEAACRGGGGAGAGGAVLPPPRLRDAGADHDASGDDGGGGGGGGSSGGDPSALSVPEATLLSREIARRTGSLPVAAKSLLAVVPGDCTAASAAAFPAGLRDVNAQQVDLRTHNSWVMKIDEVSAGEAAEVRAAGARAAAAGGRRP